jgi:hypothetical protein
MQRVVLIDGPHDGGHLDLDPSVGIPPTLRIPPQLPTRMSASAPTQQIAVSRFDRHHRGGRRGNREPGRVLRGAHALRRHPRRRLGPFDLELPVLSTVDLAAVGITALGCVLIILRDWGVLRTLGVCALASMAISLIGAAIRVRQ